MKRFDVRSVSGRLNAVVLLLVFGFIYAHLYGQNISPVELRADVYFLASPELAGREAGTPGGQTAGLYIAQWMYRLGMEPLGKSPGADEPAAFFQPFTVTHVRLDTTRSEILISRLSEEKMSQSLKLNRDAYYFPNFPGTVTISGEVLFAGYGIQAPIYHYDDYLNLDARDKILVCFYGEPLENDTLIFFNGKHQTSFAMPLNKAKTAAQQGAKALLMIPSPENIKKYEGFISRNARRGVEKIVLKDNNIVPVIYLSSEVARSLFQDIYEEAFPVYRKELLDWLQRGQQNPFGWQKTLKLFAKMNLVADTTLMTYRNVLAVRRGTDPQLADEYILISAHYDHEGVREGHYYPGADDNASGVAALLAIARYFAQPDKALKRSLIFAFWDGEEKGTLGSQYFVNHSPVPVQNIKLAINMDMVGRDASFNFAALRQPIKEPDADKKVMLFYSAQAPALKELADAANRPVGLHLLFDPNVFFTSGSDHVNFHEQGIPVIYYFTGFHTDYTSPGDTPDKLNYEKLAKIAKHIVQLVATIDANQQMPRFDASILTAPEGDFRMQY